jgi:DNA topoisomerase I
MSDQWYTRRRRGKAFEYYDGDHKVTDSELLHYFAGLVIPPAWTHVVIARNKRARVLAKGKDAADRTQYVYRPSYRAKQETLKFDRILRFAYALPELREQVSADLRRKVFDKQKVIACAVALMDEAYFRVGNEEYAKANESYGLTTLRSRHVTIEGHTVTFDFMGKSGQHQVKQVTSQRLSKMVKELDEMPGYEIFRYYGDDDKLHNLSSEDVNEYIKEIMGEEFSAKDFRTWGGTLLAAAELSQLIRPETEQERKRAIATCVEKVAQKLGNTPAIARASYIDPRVIHAFEKDAFSSLKNTVRRLRKSTFMNDDERLVLKLLS